MNLFRKLLAKLRRKKPEPVTPLVDTALKGQVEAVLAPAPPPPPQPRGRVIKQTRHAEYDPNARRRGGRIVKTMPRQLQRMKAAQEKVEDDDGPRIED